MSQLSYQQAMRFLDSLVNYEKVPPVPGQKRLFNLDRMGRLLEHLGNPHLRFKAIHIAGTKGKGSTAAMIASILRAAGYRVGLYTSPHLICPRERIRIDNTMISEEAFASYISQVKIIVQGSSLFALELRPTFFEVYTAVAFAHFAASDIDIAVVEVGLGGRLDATNVIEPLVAIITPISLDHTRQLGNDVVSIAQEKAGIIKRGCHVVIGPQQEAVLTVLKAKCQQYMASYCIVGEHVTGKLREAGAFSQSFDVLGLSRPYTNMRLNLPGKHQMLNAVTAITCLDHLNNSSYPTPLHAVRRGLVETTWPGRLQFIEKKPLSVVDCAHNRASAKCLAEYLLEFHRSSSIVLVLSALRDKDIEGIAAELCPLASHVVVTQVSSPRALPIEEIFDKILSYCKTKPIRHPNVAEAMKAAARAAGPDGLVCITGSVYLAGEVLALQSDS